MWEAVSSLSGDFALTQEADSQSKAPSKQAAIEAAAALVTKGVTRRGRSSQLAAEAVASEKRY